MKELVELMKSRGIKRFVHFHTDHWEPFSSCGGEWGDAASECADMVLRFIEETTNHPFFDKMTLFYSHPIRTSIHEVMDEDTKDMLYFEPIDDKFWERYEFAVRKVATDTNHEFQVHIHHEGVTTGKYFKWAHLPWKEGFEASTTNSERFERYLKVSLQELHRIVGLDLNRWHFLHGVWALNASDTDVCNVNDEIEILIRNGCIGDFSMPAGRAWVNSTTLAPHTVIPNNIPKGYDTEKADIKLIGENVSKESKRFLIWNQEIPFSHCSIDIWGNETIMEALENYMDTIALWIKTSPIIGDTAFIKTHAHTMNPLFWKNDAERPYDFPDVIRLFSTLKSVCEQADVNYEKWTVSEVISYLEEYDGALIEAFNRHLSPIYSRLITNDGLIPIADYRLKSMGETESGLYGYYAIRLKQSDFFDLDDARIIDFIWESYSKDAKILEIAAGCGQVSFALEKCGFENIEFCEFDKRRVMFSEAIKKGISSDCTIHSCDYRKLNLQQYKLIFVINAAGSHLGVQDYELLAETVLSGTDVILRFDKYGKDNKIFEKLDAHDRINHTNIDFENTGVRGIIRYSATNGR